MTQLAPLPRLPDLPVALPPAESPAMALPASAIAIAAAFKAILLEAQVLLDAQPEGEAPGSLPQLDADADTAASAESIPETVPGGPQVHTHAEALPAAAVSGRIAFVPVAAAEPREILDVATEATAVAEPRAYAPRDPQPVEPADPAPLPLAPSLVNLVLGTAAGLRDVELADPEASDAAPTPRAAAEPRYPTHAIPPRAAAEPLDPAARTADFQSLELHGAGPERGSQPTYPPQRETTQDSPAFRAPAAEPQAAPVSHSPAAADPLPRSGAQTDSALLAAQGSVAVASGAPAPVGPRPGPARDASTAPLAPRALPAQGEVEVVRTEPAARTAHFESLELPGRGAERASQPAAAPQREMTQDSPTLRSPAAEPQAAPVSHSPAAVDPLPRSGAQTDSALLTAQGSVAIASASPAPVEPGPARDAGGAALASRALPELPAQGELEILRGARMLAEQGGGRLQIRLEPAELGGLSLRVVVSNGAVHVSMLADQPPVADLLQRHSAELRSALENQGLRLDQLDVGTGDANLGSRDAHPREPDARTATGSRGFAQRDPGTVLPLRRFDVSTLGAVDLHV